MNIEYHDLATRLRRISQLGERNAYLWRDGVRWRRRSYAQVHARIHACAARLNEAGVGPDTPVVLQGPATPDWVEALLATFLVGGVAVPLDEATPESFRFEVAKRSQARFLIAPKQLSVPGGCTLIEMGGWVADEPVWRFSPAGIGGGPRDAAPEPPPPPFAIAWDPRRTAELVFTSGTTGEPKGVVLTHGNIASDFFPVERAFLKWEGFIRPFGELRLLTTLPNSHMFGQAMNVFLPLFMGLTTVFVAPRPRDVLEAAPRVRAWGLFTVPRLLDVLGAEVRRRLRDEGKLEATLKRQEKMAHLPFYMQHPFFPYLRRMFGWRFVLLVSGGAALPEEVQRFWERSGCLVVQGYGLTETAPVISISNPFDRGKSGSVGKPLGIQEFKLGPGGEVWVKGPNVTPSYLGASALDEEGWFHTGDVGDLDAQGHLTIRGRIKDVIVTSEGENVFPGDVEAALARAGGVREACVLGVPGPGGDRVHAVLILEGGADAESVVTQANGALQPKQRIKDYTVWKEHDFPRTATGKIRKVILLEKILAARGEGAQAVEGAPGGDGLSEGVRRLIARIAQVEPARVEPGTRLVEGLGLASLDLVELAAAFEEEYGVVLPEEEMGETTVADLERAVRDATRGAAPEATSGARADLQGGASDEPPSHRAETSGALGHSSEAHRDEETAGSTSRGGAPAKEIIHGGCTTPHWPGPDEREESAAAQAEPQKDDRPAGSAGERVFLPAGHRELPMPRWARWLPVRFLRRLYEELLQRPFVFIFTRPTVIGRQHLREAQPPFLFVANHLGYMDTGLFKVGLPFRIRGKISPGMTTRYHRIYFGEVPGSGARYWKERLQVKLVEFLWGAWPLPETARFRASLSYAGELADRGESLLIFPEGRHLKEGDMGKFRGGIGIFARDLRMPVIPVYIHGSEKVLPDGRYWPKFGKTRLVLGTPIHFAPDADPAEITKRLENAVATLMFVTTGVRPRIPPT